MSRRKKQQSMPQLPVTAEIECFSHDGRGIARINGKTTFIQGALPQERVSFVYMQQKKSYDEGRVVDILTSSPQRASPKCDHYLLCGGCSLQHLDEATQIHEKQHLLLDLLKRVGHCEPESILPPLTSESWNYRNKARLSVRYVLKKERTLIGFREKNNPRYITEINHCPILHKKVDAHIPQLRDLIDSFDFPLIITQIEVAAGDEEIALIFRNVEPLTANDEEKLRKFADLYQFIIFLQPGSAETVTRFYPAAVDEYLHYNLPDETLRFQFHPTDFTQVNAGLNRLMMNRAMQLLDISKTDVVLDLFCGLGNFSLPIAKRASLVIGIEGSNTMIERAQMNAAANGIINARFHCADLDQENSLAQFVDQPIDKLLLDPPRSGAWQIVSQMNKLNPSRIVYVSCNPATLARDSDMLVNQHGYRLRAAGVMDMFPHTSHVESIALFEKG